MEVYNLFIIFYHAVKKKQQKTPKKPNKQHNLLFYLGFHLSISSNCTETNSSKKTLDLTFLVLKSSMCLKLYLHATTLFRKIVKCAPKVFIPFAL